MVVHIKLSLYSSPIYFEFNLRVIVMNQLLLTVKALKAGDAVGASDYFTDLAVQLTDDLSPITEAIFAMPVADRVLLGSNDAFIELVTLKLELLSKDIRDSFERERATIRLGYIECELKLLKETVQQARAIHTKNQKTVTRLIAACEKYDALVDAGNEETTRGDNAFFKVQELSEALPTYELARLKSVSETLRIYSI